MTKHFQDSADCGIVLPDVVKEINKRAKATKITTLAEASAFKLKRMFSGSVMIDHITGGGYAFRRIQLLYGQKSSGKNATLYQTIAYNQRICRVCGGIRTNFWDDDGRHARFLRYILCVPKCTCGDSVGRKFLIFDYEKSIDISAPRKMIINNYIIKKTGTSIGEEEYNLAQEELKKLQALPNLTDQEAEVIKQKEKWIKGIEIQSQEVEQLATTDYLANCGILVNELMVADPEDTEEGIETSREVIKSKEIDGIIWDSIQAAVPKWVKERDSDADTMGKEAKQNALLMRHICSAFASADLKDESESYKPAFFLISQMRSPMSMYASDTYSGGHGIKHHVSLALELKREKFLREDGSETDNFKEKFYGQSIRIRAEKNKLAAPGVMETISYYFKDGSTFKVGEIDHLQEIVTLGVEFGLIEQAGAWYKTEGESFQGMDKLLKFFRDNYDFVGKLYSKMKEKF